MADRIISLDGVEHHFPGDATDAEIAKVLQSQAQYVPDSPLAHHLNEQEGDPSTLDKVNAALEPLAHPQTLSDFGSLMLSPVDATRGATGLALKAITQNAGPAVSATGRGIESAGAALEKPARYVGAWEMLTNPLKGATVMGAPPLTKAIGRGFQRIGSAITPAAEEAATVAPEAGAPTATGTAFSTGGAPPKVAWPTSAAAPTEAAAVDEPIYVGGKKVTPEQAAQLRAKIQGVGRPEVTVSPASAMQPDSPLAQPRVDIGADRVARQNGLTTQQVRDTTGPIRGEAQGEAAGMPQKPMDTIVQKLIDMGPKGQGLPESAREGYAAAANSDKGRLQVQAYLDALRKVGYGVPLAIAPGVARQSLLNQLGGSDPR